MLLPVVVMAVLGRWIASGAELDQDLDYYKRLYDFGLGKRAAYSYVSEFKRLPVYNFGLGKRSGDAAEWDYDEAPEKRVKQYSFGLGKRLPPKQYSFGLGKRPEGKLYSFGLGKRSPFSAYDEDYEPAEEGKRAEPSGRRLSERPSRAMHYNFGLGKRSAPEDKDTTASR